MICFYNETQEEGQQRFSRFIALRPILNTLDMMFYPMLNTLQNPQATYGDRKSFKGIFYEPSLDPTFVRTIFDDLMAKIQSDGDLMPSAIILEWIDTRKICETPLSDTAFASRNPTQNWIIYLRWTDSSKDQQHRIWASEAQSKWKAELDVKARERDVGKTVPQYINYTERGFPCRNHPSLAD